MMKHKKCQLNKITNWIQTYFKYMHEDKGENITKKKSNHDKTYQTVQNLKSIRKYKSNRNK